MGYEKIETKQQRDNQSLISNNLSDIFKRQHYISSFRQNNLFLEYQIEIHELGYDKHSGEISLAALSLDQQTLTFGSTDGKVYLLNVVNRTVAQEFAFHDDKINCVAFSQDGKYLASGSDDESVCLIEINGGRLVNRFFINGCKAFSLVFLYNQQIILQGNENGDVNMMQFDQNKISLIKIYGKDTLSINGTRSTFYNAKITSSNGFDLKASI